MGLSLKTCIQIFKWGLLNLIVFCMDFLFAERISQVFHIQSKRPGMTKSNIVLSSLASLVFKNIPVLRYPCYATTWQLLCRHRPSSGVVFPMRAPCFYVSLTPPALSAYSPRACLTWTIFVLAGGLSEMVLPTSFSYVLLEQWLANWLVS